MLHALALLAFTPPRGFQAREPIEEIAPAVLEAAEWKEHDACVRSERQQRFLAHYLRASSEARARAVAALIDARPVGASPSWAPGLETLRLVETELSSGSAAERVDLDQLASALDLSVAPGAFHARSEGLGDPLVVHVRRAHAVEVREDFWLELRWLASDGSALPARREAVGARAVTEQGFEMYVRGPLGPPAPWRLFGVVTRPDRPTEGFALAEVRVDAVGELGTRLEAAAAKPRSTQPGFGRALTLARRLVTSGRRGSASLSGGELLLALEHWPEKGAPTGVPVPLELGWREANGVEHWIWTYGPSREPRRALAILSPESEAEDHVLALGLWLDFAERTGTQLFALHLPSQPQDVAALLARLRQWVEQRPLYALARGSATVLLERGFLAGEAPALEGVVLCGPLVARSDPERYGNVRQLVVGPQAAGATHPRRLGLEGSGVVILDDLSLPAQVEAWH
ncbi:MAG: hypothetical protein FJ298_06735 [Planctomycetes bacterium]|nr:hypothetical protein [Planctomycetota bacterium]